MGYSLTYFKGIDHGRANGLLLGEFAEFTEKYAPEKIRDILSCMGMESVDELKRVLKRILGEKECFTREELEMYADIAENTGGVKNSFKRPTRDEILEIYAKSLL